MDFFHQLRAELAKNNVELYLIYGKANETDALKRDEVEIEWAKCISNRRIKLGGTELLWQPILKYLKNKDMVIIQLENKVLLNYYLIFARYFSKYKLAFWGPAKNMREDTESKHNRYRYFLLRKCNWWFAYTDGVKKLLIEKNYPESNITVLQNAIDTRGLKKFYSDITANEINSLKDQLGITGNKTGIFCGAMYPGKNLDFILEACHKIKKEVADFHMIFIGSGIESPKVIEASKAYTWIHYVGTKFGADRVIYFKLSVIQLMPRLIGLAILDSFAMETPIITTNNPYHGAEFDYLENGINGLISEDDIDDYSSMVIDVLKNEGYQKLISGCKISAEKYTVEAMVENFKNGILTALNT